MIQRIQSVYLLATAILMIICMCNPVGSILTPNNEIASFTNLYISMAEGAKDYAPWALFVILLFVAILGAILFFIAKFSVGKPKASQPIGNITL